MAWSGDPKTWVNAETPTAAGYNVEFRDRFDILKTPIADDGTLAGLLFSRTTSNFVKNANTTFGDVTGLNFSIAATKVWLFWCSVYAKSGVTPGLKFRLTFPSGATGRWGVSRGTSEASGILTAVIAPGTTGNDSIYMCTGLVVNSTTPGTMQVQAAQNVSNASDSTIYTNSHILAVKVG